MKKSGLEEDGSYWYELSQKEISDLVLKKYGKLIKKTEKCYVESKENGVAIMVAPRKKLNTEKPPKE